MPLTIGCWTEKLGKFDPNVCFSQVFDSFKWNQFHGRGNFGCITGSLPPCPLEGGQRGRRCPYITASKVISWFVKIHLKQIYCS